MNPATGAGYEVWLRPADGQIRLYRADRLEHRQPGADANRLGRVELSLTRLIFIDLVLSFSGELIEVYYDDQLVISATDTTYGSGAVALDVSNQPIEFDDVLVTFGPYTVRRRRSWWM